MRTNRLPTILLLALTACAGWGCKTANARMARSPVNPAVVALLEELVELRGAQQKRALVMRDVGMAADSDLLDRQVELSEARARLAGARNDREAEISELSNLLATQQKLLAATKEKVARQEAAKADVIELEIAVLEIKIRLAKATQTR